MNRGLKMRKARRTSSYRVMRGVLVLALCLGAAVVALRAYNGVPLKAYQTLTAEVPDVGNLRDHDQVRIAGVRVGQVSALELTANGQAKLDLQLEPSAPHVPIDSGVRVRSAGLLGARSVEIVPGKSKTMAGADDVLRGGEFAKTYGVSEALEVFNRQTRGGAVDTIDGLSTGLLSNGRPLNDALRLVSEHQKAYQGLLGDILDRPGAVDRLVPSADSMMSALDASRNDIAELFAPTAAALRPFATERSQVQQTLDVAPGALASTTSGLTSGRGLLAITRRLSRAVTATLAPAPDGLRAATTLLRTSPVPLATARDLLADVQPTVPKALDVLTAIRPNLRPLSRAVIDLVPLANQVGEHGCDITNFAAVFRSMTGVAVPGPDGVLGKFRLHLTPSPYETLGLNAEGTGTTHRDPYSAPCKFTGPDSTNAFIQPALAPTASGR